MTMRLALTSLTLASLGLVGCGPRPAGAVERPPSTARPSPLPAPSAAPDARTRGQDLLERLRQRLASCSGFETEMATFSEGTWDDGADTGVRRSNRNRAKLQWRKPHRLHGEMLEAPFALMVGGTLDTTDGETLTLRPKGLLSVVALKVSSTDVKLRSSRNHTFRDSQPAAQFTRLTASGAAWTVFEEGPAEVRVAIDGVRRLDAGIERELLGLSADDLAPRALTMLAQGRAVVRNTYAGFKWR